jgi:hypothetical protein
MLTRRDLLLAAAGMAGAPGAGGRGARPRRGERPIRNAPAMHRAAWQKTVQKMKDRFGAPITDEEVKQVLDYLEANYSGKS